jgi:flagellar biosynthetic protein FliQ
MTTEAVITLVQQLFFTALLVSLPVLAVSLLIGLAVSIFQTVTSIQDQTLSYVPRILAAGLAIVLTLGITLQLAVDFFQRTLAAGVAAARGGTP